MILAKLINPRVIRNENNEKVGFENDLVIYDSESGATIDRYTINLPYEMPDPEIEEMVKQKALDKANELGVIQVIQENIQWDWPENEA